MECVVAPSLPLLGIRTAWFISELRKARGGRELLQILSFLLPALLLPTACSPPRRARERDACCGLSRHLREEEGLQWIEAGPPRHNLQDSAAGLSQLLFSPKRPFRASQRALRLPKGKKESFPEMLKQCECTVLYCMLGIRSSFPGQLYVFFLLFRVSRCDVSTYVLTTILMIVSRP